VNAAEPEYELFSDPGRLVADGLLAKEAHRQRLAAVLAPQPQPEPEQSTLEQLADLVAEKVAAKLRQP
jgi:hypothetical protein